MDYKILEARITFKDNKPVRIDVLVDCTGPNSQPLTDVRAIYADTKPKGGYMNFLPGAVLNDKLLQAVAAAGCETEFRDEIFPQWRNSPTLNSQH